MSILTEMTPRMKWVLVLFVVAILAVAVLVVYLLNGGSLGEKPELETLYAQRNELLAQQRKLEADRTALRDGISCVIPAVFQITENLYETVYPLLSNCNFSATAVLCDGILPGDTGCVTDAQLSFLITQGWEIALGGNSRVTAAMTLSEWTADLDARLAALRERGLRVPSAYLFYQSEYRFGCEEILRSRGFTVIGVPAEELTEVTGVLPAIPMLPCSGDNAEWLAQMNLAVSDRKDLVLAVRYVADELEGSHSDCTAASYAALLSAVLGNCRGGRSRISSMADRLRYRAALADAYEEVAEEYEASLRTLSEQLENIESKIKQFRK